MPLLLERRTVPVGPKLTPATNIGADVHATRLEPPCTHDRAVPRRKADLEATVAVQKSGTRPRAAWRRRFTYDEIRHLL